MANAEFKDVSTIICRLLDLALTAVASARSQCIAYFVASNFQETRTIRAWMARFFAANTAESSGTRSSRRSSKL